MADMFRAEGYATGAVGKWHLGLGPKGGTDFNHLIKPNTQDIGFDYEYIIPATVDRVPCVFVENGHVVGLDPNDHLSDVQFRVVAQHQGAFFQADGEEGLELIQKEVPDIRGITTSLTTMFGISFCISSRPSSPSAAVSTW